MNFVVENPKQVPVIHQTDICVLGGSCTGVFSAIRAARLGASVTIIEKQNAFGGVATNSLVNIWHSLMDTEFKKQIIAGLTLEVVERLKKRDAVTIHRNELNSFELNTNELKIELDSMVIGEAIKPFLHSFYCAPYVKDGELQGVFIENKDGRGLIKARYFIDATGDGDLCRDLGLPTYRENHLHPPTTCATISGWSSLNSLDLSKTILEHREEYNLPEGFSWGCMIPNSNIYMLSGTRVYGVDCSRSDDLTYSEMEGRRQVRAIMDIIRHKGHINDIALQALPSYIGIRETSHVRCQYQLKGDDILYGRPFEDAIANGSYRVDVHHQDKPGITLRYLNGEEHYARPGYPTIITRWREPIDKDPTYYQVPFRTILPSGRYENLLIAGRMIDADSQAFAAVRVMVNLNQIGEAAGVASALAAQASKSVRDVDIAELHRTLEDGGSIIL